MTETHEAATAEDTEDEYGELVVVTGMTGAGRSTAAKELEDLGYFVVDNLPPRLVGDVVRMVDDTHGVEQSIAVVVDEMGLREDRPEDKPLLDIYANLYVERDSQKGIMIGHKGARLREVGTAARHQIEALLGTPVYLDLRVKIAKDWQRDPRQLRKLGF